MNEEIARSILKDYITPSGGLFSFNRYMSWRRGEKEIILDDSFTAKELEAIAWWMQNMGVKNEKS